MKGEAVDFVSIPQGTIKRVISELNSLERIRRFNSTRYD